MSKTDIPPSPGTILLAFNSASELKHQGLLNST